MIRILPLALSVILLAACSSQNPTPGNDARKEFPLPAVEENAANNAVANVANDTPEDETSNSTSAANQTEQSATPPPRPVALPKPGAFYHARGTEPFWAVTLYGGTIMLERPDKSTQHFAVSRDGDRYTGNGIQMAISQGPCSDGMSDRTYPERVQIAMSGTVLKGCGGEPLSDRDDAPYP